MKKFFGFILIILIIALALFFFGGGFGLLGSGEGVIGSNSEATSSTEASVEASQPEEEEPDISSMTILVEEDSYVIDGEEVSLTVIEDIVAEQSKLDVEFMFILTDNYGSAKAWDQLKEIFAKYPVNYTEE